MVTKYYFHFLKYILVCKILDNEVIDDISFGLLHFLNFLLLQLYFFKGKIQLGIFFLEFQLGNIKGTNVEASMKDTEFKLFEELSNMNL